MLAKFRKLSNSGSLMDVLRDFNSFIVDLFMSKQIVLKPNVLKTVEVIKPKWLNPTKPTIGNSAW